MALSIVSPDITWCCHDAVAMSTILCAGLLRFNRLLHKRGRLGLTCQPPLACTCSRMAVCPDLLHLVLSLLNCITLLASLLRALPAGCPACCHLEPPSGQSPSGQSALGQPVTRHVSSVWIHDDMYTSQVTSARVYLLSHQCTYDTKFCISSAMPGWNLLVVVRWLCVMGPAVSVSPAAATAADKQLAADGAFGSQRSVEEEDLGGTNAIQMAGSTSRQNSSSQLSSNSSSISVARPSQAVQHPEPPPGSAIGRLFDGVAAPDAIPADAAGNDDGDGGAVSGSPVASPGLLTPGQLLQQVTALDHKPVCLVKAESVGLHRCLCWCELCFMAQLLLGWQSGSLSDSMSIFNIFCR